MKLTDYEMAKLLKGQMDPEISDLGKALETAIRDKRRTAREAHELHMRARSVITDLIGSRSED